ncbi:hypothetical protein Slin14017_G039210 [Septoria linicola]|nr:hypothetical protein Slin14017_G039210 [Septoria linicola]
MSKENDKHRQKAEEPAIRDGSTSLLLASASTKPTKTPSQAKGAASSKEAEETALETKKMNTATLESYCRGYAAGVHERVWDTTHPYWSNMSSTFRADPAIGSIPQPQTLDEFLDSRRVLSEEHPTYGVKVTDLSTELDEPNGRAECFMSLEVSGVPEGVVRQNLGILEFLREDKLGVAESVRLPDHGDTPYDRWWCVRYRSFRGLGGEIMASDQ